jgi:hypothetical protein
MQHILNGRVFMPPLTLQEVIEKIRKNSSYEKAPKARVEEQSYRPEFYVPRITRRLANLKLSDLSLSTLTK